MRALLLSLLLASGCGGAERPAGEGAGHERGPALSFLEGAWQAEAEGRRTRELWLPLGGERWVGFARTSGGGRESHHELMRLERRGARTLLSAAPQGQATASFLLSRLGAGEALFTNPGHDFPQWIRYRREGALLLASIGESGEEATARWRYRREEAAPRQIEVGGRLCLEEGRLEITLGPCHCAAEVACAGFSTPGGVAVEVALLDSSCDACEEARGDCALPRGPILEVNGRALSLEAGCVEASLPILFAGEP